MIMMEVDILFLFNLLRSEKTNSFTGGQQRERDREVNRELLAPTFNQICQIYDVVRRESILIMLSE